MRGSHFMNLLAKKTSFFGGTESKWLEANNSNAVDIPRCFLLRSKFSDLPIELIKREVSL